MKKIVNYLILFHVFLLVFIPFTKAESVDVSEKIYDYANIIDESSENEIYNSIIEYINKYDMDMIVVTIDSNPKYSARSFADDFFDYNGFGKNSSRDGILLLIDMDTREFYISTSGKGILYYDDDRIDKMLDNIYPAATSGDYSLSVKTFVNDAANYASRGVPFSNRNYVIDKNGNYVYREPIHWFIIIIVSGIITAITIWIMSSKHKVVRLSSTAGEYLDKNSVNITNRQDIFLDTHTSSVYIAPSSSSSGGRSGGSSTHHSSSGRSHGGGGRHF